MAQVVNNLDNCLQHLQLRSSVKTWQVNSQQMLSYLSICFGCLGLTQNILKSICIFSVMLGCAPGSDQLWA